MVESCPDCMVLLDAGGKILDCNQQLPQLLGYPRDALLGRLGYDFLAEREKAPRIASLSSRQLARKGRAEGIVAVRRSEGPPLSMWAKLLATQECPDAAGRSVASLRDVTAREQVDRAKDEVIGLVSHEMRTPLTIIVGALETMLADRERLSPEDSLTLLRDAHSEAQDMLLLISNLLDLSRISDQGVQLRRQAVAAGDLILAAMEQFRTAAANKALILRTPGAACRDEVMADPDRI